MIRAMRPRIVWAGTLILAVVLVVGVSQMFRPTKTRITRQPALRDLQIVWSRREKGYAQLWRMRGDGTEARQITREARDHWLVGVSHVGKLRYVSESEPWMVNGCELWEVNLDGSRTQRLGMYETEVPATTQVRSKAGLISPDKHWVVRYERQRTPAALRVVNRKTNSTVLTLENDGISSVGWSPRSDYLAAGLWEGATAVLHIANPATSADERVPYPKGLADFGEASFPLLWSQDARFVCICTDAGMELNQLWVYDRSTRRWAPPVIRAENACWSPVGDYLLYYSTPEYADIEVYDAIHHTIRDLTPADTYDQYPFWLPVAEKKVR